MHIKKTIVPFSDINLQNNSLRAEIDSAIDRVISSGRFILGDEVANFEKEFGMYCGTDFAVGVSSGTDALTMALKACGITFGDEVITTSMTFFATAEAILHCGATPVFVDINLDTYNMMETQIEEKINTNTKAIIAVHLHGFPSNMDAINTISNKYNLLVIEDAAQAHGSLYKKRQTGSLGYLGCFSFYPGKNLGALGDAGIVTTNNSDIAEQLVRLRNHGREGKYYHTELGFNNRLDEIQAAILRIKLKYLDKWNNKRRSVADTYSLNLTNPGISTPKKHPDYESNWHQYAILVDRRDELMSHLHQLGITTGIHYPIPLHLQPALSFMNYQLGDFPNAEFFATHTLSLPIYADLMEDKLDYVISAINDFVQ